MIFSEVVGHKDLVASLRNMVTDNRLPHALLFAEQPGCGALTLALALTQFLFCKTRRSIQDGESQDTGIVKGLFGEEPQEKLPKDDSCQVCSSCIKIRNLTHPDFHFVFPVNTTQAVEKGKKVPVDMYYDIFRNLVKSNPYFSEQELYRAMELENKMGLIGVAEANWIINKLSFSAYEGGSKVVLIMFPERMNAEAANKLLKSIEEPAHDTYFFLVTNAPGKILKTIRSRCRLVEVPPVEKEAVAEALAERFKLSAEQAEMWAGCSMGSMGRAIELIRESEEDQTLFDDVASLFELAQNKQLSRLLALGAEIAGRGKEEQKALCASALKVLRTLYIYKNGMPELAYVSPSQQDRLQAIADEMAKDFCEKGYKFFNEAIECIERNVSAKLIFCDLCNSLYINI